MDRHIFGLLCFRNESGRYLHDMVANTIQAVDVLFCYDDQSEDDSANIVHSFEKTGKVLYHQRPKNTPSFLENEGTFRQGAWDAFERWVHPRSYRDWVLALDADECLVGIDPCQPCELKVVIDKAEHNNPCSSILFPVRECFGYDGDWPLIRTDGFWSNITAPRLFRYQPDGIFQKKEMACGSAPGYAYESVLPDLAGSLSILHYGYAHPDDRSDKHARYSKLSGHASTHIQSILTPPTLVRWDGLVPPTMRRGHAPL